METDVKWDDLIFNQFDENELESLVLFHEQVERMLGCKVVQEKALKVHVSIENTADGSITTMDAPSNDEIALLLNHIRPCLLQKDRISFNKILNVLGRRASNSQTRDYLGTLHKNYQHFKNSTALVIHIEGKDYGELEIFDAFLNGYFFHIREEESLRIVKCFLEAPRHFYWTPFIGSIIDYLNWFTLVDRVIALRVLNC